MQLFSIDLADLDLKIAPEAVQVPFFFKVKQVVFFVKTKMKVRLSLEMPISFLGPSLSIQVENVPS